MKFPDSAKAAIVDTHQDVDMNDIPETSGTTDTNAVARTYTNDNVTSQSLVSLAVVLFTACDTCIYCGGKFIG
jgi:Putative zinc-finger of transcription factor IIIC complex